jgi:hypothetical protein
VLGKVTKTGWAVISTAVAVILAGWIIYSASNDQQEHKTPAADTPPGEFLYLDRARVLSYLGQLVEGLPTSEKRTLAESADLTAEVKAGPATAGGARKQSQTTEAQVAPTVADRFYLLLRLLRDGKSSIEGHHPRKWLIEVETETPDSTSVYSSACQLQEGDFVRIHEAHLTLSPYAAVLPKATYAVLNRKALNGQVAKPNQQLRQPFTRRQKRAVNRYLRLLGRDPRLPFVVRTLSRDPGHGRFGGVTFFIPARYRSLRSEPSLISGSLTIVGKVVYRNLARPVDEDNNTRTSCGRPVDSRVARYYRDRQTVATFVPALNVAPDFVFQNLNFQIGTIAEQVAANMTVEAPVVVVIPIAIYQ